MKFRAIRLGSISALSPPSRGAWIEIVPPVFHRDGEKVAPLAGGVD